MTSYLKIPTLFFFLLFSATAVSQKVEDNFEGAGTITSWFGDACAINTSFANPFKVGINTSATVLRYVDSGGQYANVRFDVPVNFDLSTNHTFSLKIYVASSDTTGSAPNQVSLKLQDNTLGSPWSTQTEIIKTIVKNVKDQQQGLYLLVSDQSPMLQKNQFWAPFLNINVPIFTGAEMISKKFDFAVVNMNTTRIKRGYYQSSFELITENPKQEAANTITNTYLRMTEAHIKKAPEFYLWSHKRFKHKDKAPL